jgi:hypothetical protein
MKIPSVDLLPHQEVGTPATLAELVRDPTPRLHGTPFVTQRELPGVVLVGTPFVTRRELPGVVLVGTIRVAGQRSDVLERWFDAWADRTEAEELETRTTTLNILREEIAPSLDLNPPSAWQAAQQLRAWLGVTFDELSTMTGVGTSTFHSWNNSPVVPRPSKVRTLWRLFTLARSLQSRLGPGDAAVWLRSGDPSALRLLQEGRLDEVEAVARRSVVSPVALSPNPFMSARVEDRIQQDEEEVVAQREPGTMRRAARPVKKGRPQARD